MEDKQKKRRILSYVLYLTLACVIILGITYARYRSVVVGKGTVSAARVELDSTADLSKILTEMTPGKSVNVDVIVKNVKDGRISEVSQNYSVTVASTGNLPLEFTLSVKNSSSEGEHVHADSATGTDSGLTVWSGGMMPHSKSAAHEYVLTVKWKDAEKNYKYADEIDKITLTVNAEQTQ